MIVGDDQCIRIVSLALVLKSGALEVEGEAAETCFVEGVHGSTIRAHCVDNDVLVTVGADQRVRAWRLPDLTVCDVRVLCCVCLVCLVCFVHWPQCVRCMSVVCVLCDVYVCVLFVVCCVCLLRVMCAVRVFFVCAEYCLFYRALLPKRPILLKSLLLYQMSGEKPLSFACDVCKSE